MHVSRLLFLSDYKLCVAFIYRFRRGPPGSLIRSWTRSDDGDLPPTPGNCDEGFGGGGHLMHSTRFYIMLGTTRKITVTEGFPWALGNKDFDFD